MSTPPPTLQVASGGTDSSEFVAELKFLEATNAKTAYRAMAPLWGLPPACRMLTLGELEWLAAAVNRFVETHMARSVPPRVENDLAVAASGAVVPVATLEHPHVANSGGGAANAAPATPLLCGGVPFARPRAAAPRQPPQHSGLRVVRTAAGTITVHLPRPDALALVTRIVLYGALGVYEGFLTLAAPSRVYLAGQLIFAVCCLTFAGLAARTLAAPNALVLRPQEWVLRQAGALWRAQARWPFGGNFHIAERGVLDGITGCKVRLPVRVANGREWARYACGVPSPRCVQVIAHVVTLPRARTLWTRHGAATGCLCLAYADGSERPLPLRSAGLSLDALQHLAALFNAHISAATPPEHELQLSVLADLETSAACAHAASAAGRPGGHAGGRAARVERAGLGVAGGAGGAAAAALAPRPRYPRPLWPQRRRHAGRRSAPRQGRGVGALHMHGGRCVHPRGGRQCTAVLAHQHLAGRRRRVPRRRRHTAPHGRGAGLAVFRRGWRDVGAAARGNYCWPSGLARARVATRVHPARPAVSSSGPG